MITNAAIQVYQEFNGDPGGFARSGTRAQRDVLPEGEWGLLLDFIQDLQLVQQGLVSPSYADRLEQRLRTHCSGPEVISALTGIAKDSARP